MLIALNSALRRQRRRLVMLVAMMALASAVVTAHSVMGGDHMGDGMVMCLAVAETAVIAVGAAVAIGSIAARPHWLIAELPRPARPLLTRSASIDARAGPACLQVFRF